MADLETMFANLAEKYGPQAVESARAAARTDAYSCLVSSMESFGAATLLFLSGRYLMKKAREMKEFDRDPVFFIVGLAYLASGITFCARIWNIIDPWTWTAIFHPDAYIAKHVLGL